MDGNICRCTGYRAILDAMKSVKAAPDIEDLVRAPSSQLGSQAGQQIPDNKTAIYGVCADNVIWRRPASVQDLVATVEEYKDKVATWILFYFFTYI